MTHPVKGNRVGAALSLGPQPWALKNRRPGLRLRASTPMPTHCRSQQKGGYAGRSFAPGSPRGDPAMACLLGPVWSAHSPPFGCAGVPPSSCPPAPAPGTEVPTRAPGVGRPRRPRPRRLSVIIPAAPRGSRQQVSAALLAERLPELFTVPVFATCPAATRQRPRYPFLPRHPATADHRPPPLGSSV